MAPAQQLDVQPRDREILDRALVQLCRDACVVRSLHTVSVAVDPDGQGVQAARPGEPARGVCGCACGTGRMS